MLILILDSFHFRQFMTHLSMSKNFDLFFRTLSSKINNNQLSWVSFLDGMQRVLLFTDHPELAAQLAKTTGEMERIEQEVDISIYGVGLSLVNNDTDVRHGS